MMMFHKLPAIGNPARLKACKLLQLFRQFKANAAWGLDVGGNALRAVKICQTPTGLVVDDVDVIAYPAIPSGDNFMQPQYLGEAIRTFLSKHSIAKSDNVLARLSQFEG